MVCERRSPEGQNRAGRGRPSEEVGLMVGRALQVGRGGSRVDRGAGGTCSVASRSADAGLEVSSGPRGEVCL